MEHCQPCSFFNAEFFRRIMPEAAQRFRDELERLTSSQSMYLSGAMVFAMLFAAAMFLNAEDLFVGYPSWQLYLQLGVLALAGIGALFESVGLYSHATV